MSILVISPCPESTVEKLGIKSWPIWTCDVSSFDWAYENKENCLLIECEVKVPQEGGQPICFSAGDLVTFPAGINCRWEVQKVVRKHYRFGD